MCYDVNVSMIQKISLLIKKGLLLLKEINNSKSNIKKIVSNLHKIINNDKFTIVLRDKNKRFILKYRLSKKNIKKILISISEDNFVIEEFDNDTLKYGLETVVIFVLNKNLIDIHGFEKNVEIYIKIKLKKENLPVISIHESGM